MIHFVGAGCGAADLITLRGKRLIEEADVIIYAGSLVSPALLSGRKPGAERRQGRQPELRLSVEIRAKL